VNHYFIVANCGQPLNPDSINIIGYTRHMPVMEGINVSFSCNADLVLSGPSSSTCMGNGEWEPDPSMVECRGNDNTIHIIIYACSRCESFSIPVFG
jgi:hypothetical protein